MAAERLTSAQEDQHPRLCPFEVGKSYTKEDIYRIFEVSAARRGGNWNTGYTKYDGYWFIFSNIGTGFVAYASWKAASASTNRPAS